MTYEGVPTPIYIIEEKRLRENLELIRGVAREADVEIILAFKAFALWKTFPIFREYISSTTASSLAEARLAAEEFGSLAHTYSPCYTDDEIDEIIRCSSHLTFNSLTQYERFHERVGQADHRVSMGIRINPEYSEIATDLYNPCAPGTRFGITADKLPEQLPDAIDGFHCHCHCESSAEEFERTLSHIEEKFSRWFPQLKWINFGGGHLMTRKDYNVALLVRLLKDFKRRHPNLRVILEPGSAFAWQTGPLVAKIEDIVEDKGIRTAILNVSFTCHMPDCLEMPYKPVISQALTDVDVTQPTYRIGGNSCLSGDYVGDWSFDHELKAGERLTFEDMNHYTTVKTNMFNGIDHPAIVLQHIDGTIETLREFTYDDYKSRMS